MLRCWGYDGRNLQHGNTPMCKTFRAYSPDQQLLLSAALREWLPDDQLAYFISDLVEHLALSAITARYQGEECGGPLYHPRMMVKVLLYWQSTGALLDHMRPSMSSPLLSRGRTL